MQKVHALLWCDCIYESGFQTVALYQTKRDAFKAMVALANQRWYEERQRCLEFGARRSIPLQFCAWKVATLDVIPE